MNVFESVKENVTARQAAEMYGIRVNRNGMACCPFHDDKHPSMKVDKRFHCFGCQADGDVIDFVARLYGLPGLEAAKKLAADFGILYESRGRASPKPARRSVSAELRFWQAERKCFRVLSDYLHLLERWETAYAPKSPGDGWNPLFVEAMQKREYVGYLLDTLLAGTKEEKAAVITGHGKEVERIEGAIKVAANEYQYHPVRDYLNSLQWDGTERVRYALRHFLGAEVSDYNYEVLLLFMLGAVARVFKPGTKFEVMLCLVGGQGAGKSTFFRFLAVRDEWFSDDLRKLDDDNVYRKLQGHWIIEMSEMIATANAKSIEDIKSFLSRQKETTKPPMKSTQKTTRGSACLPGLPTRWTSCPLTEPGTGVSCRCRCRRKRRRFTFWKMKPLPEPTSGRCGRRSWRFTGRGM